MTTIIHANAVFSTTPIFASGSPQTQPTVPLQQFLNGQPVDDFISALPQVDLLQLSLHDMQATLLLLLGRYSRFKSSEDLERIFHVLPYYGDAIRTITQLSGIGVSAEEDIPHALDVAIGDFLDNTHRTECTPREEWAKIIKLVVTIEKKPNDEVVPSLARSLSSWKERVNPNSQDFSEQLEALSLLLATNGNPHGNSLLLLQEFATQEEDIVEEMRALSLETNKLHIFPKGNKLPYIQHLRACLKGLAHERVDSHPTETREAIFSWFLSYCVESMLHEYIPQILMMLPYCTLSEWPDIKKDLRRLDLRRPLEPSVEALVAWKETVQPRAEEMVKPLKIFADFAYEWYTGKNPETREEIELILRRNFCKLLWHFTQHPTIQDDELSIDYAIEVLFELHNRSRSGKSKISLSSPKWTEELSGPERELFIGLMQDDTRPSDYKNNYLGHYFHPGASKQAVSLAVEMSPSFKKHLLTFLTKSLLSDKYVDERTRFVALAKSKYFTQELREKLVVDLLNGETINEKLFGLQLAFNIELTYVSQIISVLKEANEVTEAHKKLFTTMLSLSFYSQKQLDPEALNSLKRDLLALSQKYGVAKEFPATSIIEKVRQLKVTSQKLLRQSRSPSPEDPALFLQSMQKRKLRVSPLVPIPSRKPDSPDPESSDEK